VLRRQSIAARTKGVVILGVPFLGRVSLLNGFALENGGSPRSIEGLPPSSQRLLAYLGLCAPSARTAIAGTLWPDVPDEHALASLRTTLWRLHRAAPGLIDSSHTAVSLSAGVVVDVHELDGWAEQVFNSQVEITAVSTPRSALSGELLPGWYEDWVLLERERVRQMRMHALERLSERLVGSGHFAEAVQAASAAVIAEPLRESAHRVLIHAHIQEGNFVEGLRQYDTYRALLDGELGLTPTPLMDELVESCLAKRGDVPGQRASEPREITQRSKRF
jgi:DNA-binding SARP family transcriptional activator